MKKEIYLLTKKYFVGSRLNKDEIVSVYLDYRKDGYTVDKINKIVAEAYKEINRKQEIRRKYRINNDILLNKDKHFLFKKKFLKPILKELEDWFKRKTNVKEVIVELSEDSFLHFTSNKIEDWNRYSKGWHRAHGPAKYTQDMYEVPLSIRMLRKYRHLLFADGIATINVLEEKEVNNVRVYEIIYIKFTKNKRPNPVWGWLAEKDGYFYHADTEDKAVKGVLRKIKLNKKDKDELKLIPDTYITKRLYKKLTGACDSGIDDFVNAYLSDYRKKGKIKLRDLLPILEQHKAYGVDKIKKLIEKDRNENRVLN